MEHMKRKTEIDKLEREEHLEREEWIGLLTGWDEEDRAYAGERAREISHRYFGNRIYVNLQAIAEMTAITVACGAVIQKRAVIACRRRRFCPAARQDMGLDFVPLYSREEKTVAIQRTV